MKKLVAVLALLLLGIFMVSYSWAGEVRVWTSGKHTIEGEFVELVEGDSIVRIRKTNGKVVRIPLSKLSQEDQEYVKDSENPFEEENTGTALPASSGKSKPAGTPLPASSGSGRTAGERMVKTVDGIDYAFRWCPPGEFMMGAPKSECPDRPDFLPYDETPHKVKITRGFWLLETEVTQAMLQSVMGESIEIKARQGRLSKDLKGKGDTYPMYYVSWNDCQEFCQKLSQKLGQRVQLPTEAQWEYACRAGTTGDYAGTLDEMAWYWDNSSRTTHAVGQKQPNGWGLYDMHGNVWEWCSDYWDKEYYSKSPTSDPENTTASSYRVIRGGCWYDLAEYCRSADRSGLAPGNRNYCLGLRVLLVPGQD